MLQHMTKYQKINHFPRTFEITRKDRMYANVVKFKEMFPNDGFNFLPKTYVLPEQYSRLRKRLSKESDDKWILKPNSSSRGRGIFIIKDINDISFDSTEKCVVSR
jgi:tubulin polyglutamylase TTLL5